jgi:diacylglycerol kinase family enzyme
MLAVAHWHSPRLRLIADRAYDEIAGVTQVAVANGRRFGASPELAPAADLSDGKFDIVIAEGIARRFLLPRVIGLPGPEWLPDSALRRVRAARLTAAPTLDTEGPVEVETDGESAGLLPATFEILPSAINLRV